MTAALEWEVDESKEDNFRGSASPHKHLALVPGHIKASEIRELHAPSKSTGHIEWHISRLKPEPNFHPIGRRGVSLDNVIKAAVGAGGALALAIAWGYRSARRR